MLLRIVTAVIAVALPAVLIGQEPALPRYELDNAIKAAQDAKVQELTAEVQTIQKAIAAGGKGYGKSRREAIINARKKLAEVETEMADAKKTPPTLELNVDKLAVGQIGKLYRVRRIVQPSRSGGGSPALVAGSGAAFSASFGQGQSTYREPVEVRVIQIMDASSILVTMDDKALWLRTATAGMTTDQKLTLDKPVKVVGTKSYHSEAGPATVFELAFFAAQ